MPKSKSLLSKNFRGFLWVIVFVTVAYLIARNIDVFGNIVLVMLGFGAVVLVHEFGHFVVAKLAGITVEAFSVFMPPILFGVRKTEGGYRFRLLPKLLGKGDDEADEGLLDFTVGKKGKAGDTEYRIGLIPFGGFVKMLGQDDIGPVKTSDDPRSFANKPVGIRVPVIAAGVIFNVISAGIIFMIVFLIGIKLSPPVVGAVVPNSPAARAGIKPGDEVIEIAGKRKDLDFSNIVIAAALSDVNEAVPLKVRDENGSEKDFKLVAERLPGGAMRDFGIVPPLSLTIAEISDANALFERTYLLPGDHIKSVNGKNVQTHWELEGIIQNAFVPTVTVSAERTDPVSKEVKLIKAQIRLGLASTRKEVKSEATLGDIYFMVPRLRIIDVPGEQDSNDTECSLQSSDIVLAIGDVENPTYKEMREVTIKYEDRELPIKVLRMDARGVEKDLVVTVVPKRSKDSGKVVIGVGVTPDFEHAVAADTVSDEDGKKKIEIQRGALITAVNGTSVSNFYDIAREIGRNIGERIKINYRLDDETLRSVALDANTSKEFVAVKSTFAEFIPFKALERLYRADGPVDAVAMGGRRTIMFIAQTYVTLRRLIGGLISPKDLMGPVGIIAFSYRIVAEQPLVHYVYFLGLLSAVIAVFNFLPLPPLDGGLIALLLVEKIKGSALSERVQGIIAYTGWALIGALLLYITFNDIVRSFFS